MFFAFTPFAGLIVVSLNLQGFWNKFHEDSSLLRIHSKTLAHICTSLMDILDFFPPKICSVGIA
jgi:hypothetical protein